MGRPLDPTSRNQVDQRAKRLRDPESGWASSLCLTIALAASRAEDWQRHLDGGGDPGPLLGSFPALPEEPGSVVQVEPEEVGSLQWLSFGPHLTPAPEPPGRDPGDVVFYRPSEETGEPEAVTVEEVEAIFQATADLAQLLEARHLRLLLSPTFYREAATWMGELLVSPPGEGPDRWKGEPLTDLWSVPALPLRIPPEEDLEALGQTREEAAMGAGLWHFGRQLYRQLLNPRPDALGRRGLENPARLRQLLEELELREAGGLKTQPVGEKALARATTHEVPMLGFRAFPRPDKWDETEDGRGRYLHDRRSADGYRRWELTFQEGREDLAFASLARCQQVLEKGGLEITALHGLLCCLVMQQEDPGARFEVRGDDLLKDLGLTRGGGEGNTRSDLLRRVASAATLLGGVRCEGKARNNSTGTRISMEFGPMWSIAVRADGQLKLLEEPEEEELGIVTDLTLTITPGTWVQSQRVLSSSGGSHLLYVPVATRVLSLGRYRQELAFRLGIHLAMGVRERRQWRAGRANVRVGQLLEEVLPKGELERALQDRDSAHKLRNKWNAALATLQQVVGFRFEFPPGQYPPALIPEDLRPPEMGDPGPAPHGALEQLLASRLEIHWPEPVVEAIHQKALPQKEREATFQARTQQRAALQSRPNGARLREALEQAKASGAISGRREAADRLGMSVAQLSKLENGHKPLPERELQRCLNLLGTLKPGKS
jgi:hypothetical protein